MAVEMAPRNHGSVTVTPPLRHSRAPLPPGSPFSFSAAASAAGSTSSAFVIGRDSGRPLDARLTGFTSLTDGDGFRGSGGALTPEAFHAPCFGPGCHAWHCLGAALVA